MYVYAYCCWFSFLQWFYFCIIWLEFNIWFSLIFHLIIVFTSIACIRSILSSRKQQSRRQHGHLCVCRTRAYSRLISGLLLGSCDILGWEEQRLYETVEGGHLDRQVKLNENVVFPIVSDNIRVSINEQIDEYRQVVIIDWDFNFCKSVWHGLER